MEKTPANPLGMSRPPSGWKVVQVCSILTVVLSLVLSRIVGPGDVGVVNLAPRPTTFSTSALCYLAVLGAVVLAWSIVCDLRACLLLIRRGYWGFWGPLPVLGSLSTILLCWSLWDFEGELCTVVLLAGFALTDGAVLACELWDLTGGRLIRAARAPAPPS